MFLENYVLPQVFLVQLHRQPKTFMSFQGRPCFTATSSIFMKAFIKDCLMCGTAVISWDRKKLKQWIYSKISKFNLIKSWSFHSAQSWSLLVRSHLKSTLWSNCQSHEHPQIAVCTPKTIKNPQQIIICLQKKPKRVPTYQHQNQQALSFFNLPTLTISKWCPRYGDPSLPSDGPPRRNAAVVRQSTAARAQGLQQLSRHQDGKLGPRRLQLVLVDLQDGKPASLYKPMAKKSLTNQKFRLTNMKVNETLWQGWRWNSHSSNQDPNPDSERLHRHAYWMETNGDLEKFSSTDLHPLN